MQREQRRQTPEDRSPSPISQLSAGPILPTTSAQLRRIRFTNVNALASHGRKQHARLSDERR